SQYGDAVRNGGGDRLLDRSLHEVDPLPRVARVVDQALDELDAVDPAVERPRPWRRSLRSLGPGPGRGLLERRRVGLGRLRHPLEGVEEVDIAVVDTELLQGLDHGQDRAAAPDAALDERTRHTA